jgi:hypothetical protein
LLLLSKGIPAHPQVQQLEAETLKQKYSNALVEQLRLQEQVMVRDRIIEDNSRSGAASPCTTMTSG